MTNSVLSVRPLFRDSTDENQQARPISGWAVLSLIVGVSCLLVPISMALIPISLLAIAMGWYLSIRLGRPDADLGRWMANVCLGMGIMSVVWVLVAYKVNTNYLSGHASQHAGQLLDLIAQGKIYQSLELCKPMGQRQKPDVDLESFYEAYAGDVSLEVGAFSMLMSNEGERNPEKDRKISSAMFRENPVVVYVQQHPQTQWNYVGTKELKMGTASLKMKVIMQSSEDTSKRVVIEVLRQEATAIDAGRSAEWRIGSLAFDA